MDGIEFPKVEVYKNQTVRWIQPKMDGHLIMLTPEGIFSRNWKDLTEKLVYLELPRFDAYIVGELHHPDEHATSVPSLIKRKERLIFTPFAVPRYNGEDLREWHIHEIEGILNYLGFQPPLTKLVPNPIDIDALLLEAKHLKIEGWVLKNRHYSEWYKLKPLRTLDCIILAAQTSLAPTNYGDLQSVIVAVTHKGKYKVVASVGSGFDADFRKDPGNLTHRICEIAYDSLAADGRLKFPRFIRFRDDKEIPDEYPV